MRINSYPQRSVWQRAVIAGFVATIALFVVAWLFLLLSQFTNVIYDYATENADSLAQSTAAMVEAAPSDEDMDALFEQMVENRNMRIQLFDTNYHILADSQSDSGKQDRSLSKGGNIAPELAGAKMNGSGSDRRRPDDGGIEQVYVARSCKYQGNAAIVRVSTDSRALADALATNQAVGLGLMLGCLLFASLACYIAYTVASSAFRKSDRLKTQFVANASHELKTPLAGLKLLSESIVRAVRAGNYSRLEEFAQRIDEQTTHLDGIVTRLVNISHSNAIPENAGLADPAQSRADFAKIVSDSFSYHSVLANDKRLAYTLDVEPLPPEKRHVRMSEEQAHAVVDNVVENAIQYTQQGFVHVQLANKGRSLVLTVEDSGAGVPKREQSMVFERFYRSKSSSASNPKGTGLGLSIVRDTVQAAGGNARMESSKAGGTTVIITLPLASPVTNYGR